MKEKITKHTLLKNLELDPQTKAIVDTLWCISVGDVFGVNSAARLASGEWNREQYKAFMEFEKVLKMSLNKAIVHKQGSKISPDTIEKSNIWGRQKAAPKKRASTSKAVNPSIPEPPAPRGESHNALPPSRPDEDSQLLRPDQFSVRTWSALRLMKISTQAELLALNGDRIRRVRNVGQTIWMEIERAQGRLRSGLELESRPIPQSEPEKSCATPVQRHVSVTRSAPPVNRKPPLDAGLIEQFTRVLSVHFANGYRLVSPIEMKRFRDFAEKDFGAPLTLADEELKSYIAACGAICDGKVYTVSAQTKDRIRELAEDYFAGGAQAIFYAEFYAKNEHWLFEAGVVSEEVLTTILTSLFRTLSFTQRYFGYTGVAVSSVLETEILRVWGDDVLLTYNQLAERLQYVPLDRIKNVLGQNGDFIWNSTETFSHVSRVEITDEEREAIREAAAQECDARGYVSITTLPFGEIEERNYELSSTAVHNAVHRICLSEDFEKKGKIITRKGRILDVLIIMKDYCRNQERCSLDDLLELERELTGEAHHRKSVEAGNAVLVRTDRDTFVADHCVHFDTDRIDGAIALCVTGDYLPLRSFTTFAAFPDCGQIWNVFLLESYCRRFSRAFRCEAPAANSRNAGVVIRRTCDMDYAEIMSDAVANAGIHLTETCIAKFLSERGYIGRSTISTIDEIISKAKAIRESKD